MKNVIRVTVVAGLLAWPGLEIYRIQAAKQQLAASEVLGQSITQKLASLERLQKVAQTPTPAPQLTPVSNTQTTEPREASESQ